MQFVMELMCLYMYTSKKRFLYLDNYICHQNRSCWQATVEYDPIVTATHWQIQSTWSVVTIIEKGWKVQLDHRENVWLSELIY